MRDAAGLMSQNLATDRNGILCLPCFQTFTAKLGRIACFPQRATLFQFMNLFLKPEHD
jgi:hypothetical protein